ncbi:MAG: VTT domain-containing protein [Dehalococcoidia bacterium]|nr:VTT domain-containing protein [Dehalococcoidia bacterium]
MNIVWQILGAVTAGGLLWLGIIFLLSLLGEIGLPVTSPILEGMLVFTGFQIAHGGYFIAAVPFLVIVCTGRICGSTSAYQLSSSWGDTIISKFGKYLRLTPERIMLAKQKLGTLAVPSIIAARFTPGFSVVSSIVCGISRIGHKHFFIAVIAHILVWEAIFLALGALGGKVSERFFSPETYPTILGIWIALMVTMGIVVGYIAFRRIKNAG